MSIIDEIKNRKSQKLVEEERIDIFTEIKDDNNAISLADSQLNQLKNKLCQYPEIAKQHPVRLQVDIKEEIDTLCQKEKITTDTLLEALFMSAKANNIIADIVVMARNQLIKRKEVGNLKSRITQLEKLLD